MSSLRLRRATGGLLVSAFALGCNGARVDHAPPPTPINATKPANAPCELAKEQRTRGSALIAEGKLDRAARVLARADALCPSGLHDLALPLLTTLIALDRYADARALILRIEGAAFDDEPLKRAVAAGASELARLDRRLEDSAAARAPMLALFDEAEVARARADHSTARRLFLEAWEARHPNGQALLGAAASSMSLGDRVDARRLFDRAIVDLEISEASPLVIDDPVVPAERRTPRVAHWSPDSAHLFVGIGSQVLVAAAPTWRDARLLLPPVAGGAIDDLLFFDEKTLAMIQRPAGEGDPPAAISLWSSETGTQLRTFSPVEHTKGGLTLSLNGTMAAMSTTGLHVALWDVPTGHLLRVVGDVPKDFESASDPAFLAFSPDGQQIAVAPACGAVRIWNTRTGAPVGRFGTCDIDHATTSIFFSSDGKSILHTTTGFPAHADQDPTRVQIWKVSSAAEPRMTNETELCKSGPQASRFDDVPGGGHRPAGPCTDYLIRSIKIGGGPPPQRRVLSPDLRVAVLSRLPRSLRIVEVVTGDVVRELEAGGALFASSGLGGFSPDGKLFLGNLEGGYAIWEIASGRLVRRISFGETDPVETLAFRAQGGIIAGANRHNKVRIWRSSLRELDTRALPDDAQDLAFDTTGRLIAARWDSSTSCIRVWDTANRESLTTVATGASAGPIALSSDARKIAWIEEHAVHVVELATGKTLLTTPERTPRLVTFRADGRSIAIVEADGAMAVWDLDTGTSSSSLGSTSLRGGSFISASALALHPEGKTFAVAVADGSIQIRETTTGATLEVLHGGPGPRKLLFRPDDPRILLVGLETGIEVWRLPEGKLTGKLSAIRDSAAGYVFTTGLVETFGAPDQEYRRCHVGAVSLPFEACEERAATEGLLADILSGTSVFLEP
jgi:WD40 repeat protein/tetratricopeptide (TPR) repeat protein